jgi:hypothetical protein
LDGDLPKLRGNDRFTYGIYYACASQFGWTKEQVDKQPVEFLMKIFSMHREQMEEARKEHKLPPMGRNMSKNF